MSSYAPYQNGKEPAPEKEAKDEKLMIAGGVALGIFVGLLLLTGAFIAVTDSK